jgi:hypothetical protein
MEFNEQFLAFREVKRTVCQNLQAKYARLADINKELGLEEKLTVPQMQPDEEPERRLEVTDQDIADYLSAVAEREGAKSNKADMAFGAVGSGAQNDSTAAKKKEGAQNDSASKKKEGGAAVARAADRRVGKQAETPEEAIARVAANTPMSALEKAEKTITERRLVCFRMSLFTIKMSSQRMTKNTFSWHNPCCECTVNQLL